MRSLLLTLCVLLSAAPSAQPSAPTLEGYRLVLADGRRDLDAGVFVAPPSGLSGDLGTGVVTAVLSGTGGLVGGGIAVVGVYALDDCSPFGCSETSAARGLYAPAWVVGGAVGTVATVWMMGRDGNPSVRRDDWKRALVGVAVGSLAGAALMASVPDLGETDGPLWPIIAVPVLQGVGAGVAVGLRP